MIAALLLGGAEAVEEVRGVLVVDDFFREQHRWLYSACLGLYDRNEEITVVTALHELLRMDVLDAIGGEYAVSELVSRHFTWHGVVAHARIVARDAFYRRLIQAAGQIAQIAYEGGPEPERVMDAARGLLDGVAPAVPVRSSTAIYDRAEYQEVNV